MNFSLSGSEESGNKAQEESRSTKKDVLFVKEDSPLPRFQKPKIGFADDYLNAATQQLLSSEDDRNTELEEEEMSEAGDKRAKRDREREFESELEKPILSNIRQSRWIEKKPRNLPRDPSPPLSLELSPRAAPVRKAAPERKTAPERRAAPERKAAESKVEQERRGNNFPDEEEGLGFMIGSRTPVPYTIDDERGVKFQALDMPVEVVYPTKKAAKSSGLSREEWWKLPYVKPIGRSIMKQKNVKQEFVDNFEGILKEAANIAQTRVVEMTLMDPFLGRLPEKDKRCMYYEQFVSLLEDPVQLFNKFYDKEETYMRFRGTRLSQLLKTNQN